MEKFCIFTTPFLQLRQKILEAHANVKDLNLLEAKMNFVKAWQSLPDFGVSLFVVRFHGEKKDELLGIAYNRLMRMSLQTGDHIKTWRYNTIKVYKNYPFYFYVRNVFIESTFAGMEHQLGNKAYDDPVRRWQECHLSMPFSRL